jgi:hypothetical protein
METVNVPQVNQKRELNLHVAGGRNVAVEFADIGNVPLPETTRSFVPVSHNRMVEIFRDQLAEKGLSVIKEHHTLAKYGQNYFGLFQIDMKKDGATSGTVVGLRNSHCKDFRAGICAGNAPFVCDNLVFHNEIVIGRRHTTNIMLDLPKKMGEALGKLGEMWTNHETRVEKYTNTNLDDETAGNLILRSYRSGAIGKNMIADVLDQWDKPLHEEFAPRNLWSLHNAFTEIYKGNLNALPIRSSILHSVLDPFAGINIVLPAEIGAN